MLDDQAFFTALPLGFGVLHLLLFANLPRLRGNLYYGLFLIFIAVTIYADFQHLVDMHDGLISVQRAFLALSFIFGTRFFYNVFLDGPSRHYPWLVAGLALTGVLATIEPNKWFLPLQLMLAVSLMDGIRVMVVGLLQRREDVWLIAVGFVVFVAFASIDLLQDFGLIEAARHGPNGYHYGLAGLAVMTSAFLARDVARTHHRLLSEQNRALTAEVERERIEGESRRRSRELDEARQLQLSMLPRALQTVPGLEVATLMNTASEVGGDYYDFWVSPSGALTVAVGDATGHGMRAGMVVTATKTLLATLANDEPLDGFLTRASSALKSLRLPGLYMSLVVARWRGGTLRLASAGMPPVLVWRAAEGRVEVVLLKALPLGGPAWQYTEVELRLQPGDVVLFMSDGFPERFNASREPLGYDESAQAFAEAAASDPADVIAQLAACADRWAGGRALDDDLTLVTLRVTDERTENE